MQKFRHLHLMVKQVIGYWIQVTQRLPLPERMGVDLPTSITSPTTKIHPDSISNALSSNNVTLATGGSNYDLDRYQWSYKYREGILRSMQVETLLLN